MKDSRQYTSVLRMGNRCAGMVLAGTMVLLGTAGYSSDDSELPLPQWSDHELQAPAIGAEGPLLGGGLLPQGLLEMTPEDIAGETPLPRLPAEPPSIAANIVGSRPASDMSLFLPDALLGPAHDNHKPPAPTPAGSLRPVNTSVMRAAFAWPAEEHLVDPVSLVSETQREDLLRFLEYHASDARIKAYVMVIDRDEKLPANGDLSQIASGALARSDSCLAVYPVGEPWRARLFLSRAVHDVAPPAYLTSLVEDCAQDALQSSDPLEQLHRFTVRLSIRLFWLERMLPSLDAPVVARKSTQLLPEITKGPQEEPEATSLLSPAWIATIPRIALWSLVGLLAVGATSWISYRIRNRRSFTHVWILPEEAVAPRLGGAFCGGGGASLQYR